MPWVADGYSKEDAVETMRLGSEGWDAGEEFDYAIVVDGLDSNLNSLLIILFY